MVFVSYHNIDIAQAFQLADLLIRYYRNAWLDRFEIGPCAEWRNGIREARERSTHVIAIVSDEYLQSAYCRSEFEYFFERGVPVTAVIARDFSTEEIGNFTFNDWVDLRRWFDDPSDLSAENLLSQFPQSDTVTQTGERLDYLRQFIQETETGFSKMPTSWAAMRNGDMPSGKDTRPRMLHTGLLHDWGFTAIKAGNALPVSDLLSWAENQPKFMIAAEAGSGKTFFARLLALEQAHSALRDEQAAVPIWFDLALWDANTRSLDHFVEANWPLLSFWRHWMETHSTVVFLDNWSDFCRAYPGSSAEIINWIDKKPNQRFVLLSCKRCSTETDLPTLRINRISAPLAQRFAGGVATLDQQNSFRQLLRQNAALIEDSPLAYLSVGLELLSADRALAYNQWQNNPVPSILRLRDQHLPASTYGLRLQAVRAGLEELAWSMMHQARHRFVTCEAARDTVRDARVIEYAQAIGILVASGPLLRFESELLQYYLAAERLKRDGLIKYLTRPAFDAELRRVPRKWDKLALLVVDSIGEESRLRLVDQIADIDPFLAGMCLRRRPEFYNTYSETLIQKLVDLCAQNSSSREAFRTALKDLSEPDNTAELLIRQLSRLNNKLQLWLWYEIGALPLELPLDFVKRVANVDRQSALSASDQLAPYSLSRSVAYLVALSLRDDPNLRRNAIWFLGELKYLPTAILLLDYLDKAEHDEIDTILLALMRFAYSEILARVLAWSQDRPEHRPSVLSALSARKRKVTSRLLSFADAKRLTLQPEFYDIVVDTPERDIAIGLAQIATEHVKLPASIDNAVLSTGDAANLHRRVFGAIKHLPNREGFQQLLDDIEKVLRDPPESTVIAGSNLDALLYGESVFDDISAQAVPPATGSLPVDLTRQLRHTAWQQRRQAVNQLMSYAAEDSLPLLLEATADAEKRVRLPAYEILSQFEDEGAAQKAVVAALSDPDLEIVSAATELLLGMAFSEHDVFYDLLESSNTATVAAAIAVLGASRQRQAIDQLGRLLNDGRQPADGGPTIGQRARDAISQLELSVMAGVATRSNGGSTLANGQGGYSAEEKVRRTIQVLRDDDWGRTQKAAKFLRKFARYMRGQGNDDVRHMLCEALSDVNWSVRWAAAEALAMLRDRAAIPALSGRLQDSSWIVQVAAVRALAELKATESAAQVAPLLESRHTQVREATAEALGAFRDMRSLQALGNTLTHDSDDFVRLAALKAICQIGPDDLRPWLELALSDAYMPARLFAMTQLSPEMEESDIPLLQKLLEDDETPAYESESPRDLAIKTLRRIDSAACRAILESIQPSEDRTGA